MEGGMEGGGMDKKKKYRTGVSLKSIEARAKRADLKKTEETLDRIPGRKPLLGDERPRPVL